MWSWLMVPLVVANTLVLVWLLRHWARERDGLLLTAALPLLMLPYDTGLVALGHTIGAGELLRLLSIPRMNWFYLTLPLLIIVAAGAARRAGLRWAASRGAMGAFCAVAALLIVTEYPRIIRVPTLYPACHGDLLRYVTSVLPAEACTPGQAGISVAVAAPWGAILTFVIVLVVGIALWWQRRWPWLAVGTLASGVMLRLPASAVGPLGTYVGDFLSMGAVVWTAIHFCAQSSAVSPRRATRVTTSPRHAGPA
jgi:hypothetical protein